METANSLCVGDKIGYINERTGNYKYVPIIEILPDGYMLNEKLGRYADNIYKESIEKLNKYINTEDNEGFKKPLLKIRRLKKVR